MTALPPLTDPITDGVVAIRQWRLDDAPAMQRIFQDEAMYRWTDAVPDEPLAEFEATIRRGWQRRLDGDRLTLAITCAGEVVGAIDLMVGELGRGELGYAVGAWGRGNGYAVRAVRLLTRWTFASTDLARLELPIPIENVRSRRVAERAGYREEGVLRSYLWLREDGPRYDVAMYARTTDDAPDT